MLRDNHPPYPFPTIQEVVCEIYFRLGRRWETSFYSEYLKKVEEQFPTFEPIAVPTAIHIETRVGGELNMALPTVIRYKHISRDLFLQLSESRIVVNVLPAYPGWGQVSEDIRYAWNHLCQISQPVGIDRIGLRYINRIARSVEGEMLGRWIAPNDYVPQAVLQARKGFSAQVSRRFSEEDRIAVRVSDQTNDANELGAFILDIDRITEKKIGSDEESLLEHATNLHDDVWNVFNSAKSDDLERLLQGEFL